MLNVMSMRTLQPVFTPVWNVALKGFDWSTIIPASAHLARHRYD